MARLRNLSNQKFNKLSVLYRDLKNTRKGTYWMCKCDCGLEKSILSQHLTSGKIKDCGCSYILLRGHPYKSHGLSKKIPEYAAWENMKRRCYYIGHNRYRHYGGRGIKVCDRWLNSFENFLFDMGRKPSKNHSIDRIDVNGDYEPSNCRWATRKEQASNKTTNRFININGVIKTVTDWANLYNIRPSACISRIKRGWPLDEKLFTTPVRKITKHKI